MAKDSKRMRKRIKKHGILDRTDGGNSIETPLLDEDDQRKVIINGLNTTQEIMAKFQNASNTRLNNSMKYPSEKTSQRSLMRKPRQR